MEVHCNPEITARHRWKFCRRAMLFYFPYRVRQHVAKFQTEESVQARRAYVNWIQVLKTLDRSHVLAMVTPMRQNHINACRHHFRMMISQEECDIHPHKVQVP